MNVGNQTITFCGHLKGVYKIRHLYMYTTYVKTTYNFRGYDVYMLIDLIQQEALPNSIKISNLFYKQIKKAKVENVNFQSLYQF